MSGYIPLRLLIKQLKHGSIQREPKAQELPYPKLRIKLSGNVSFRFRLNNNKENSFSGDFFPKGRWSGGNFILAKLGDYIITQYKHTSIIVRVGAQYKKGKGLVNCTYKLCSTASYSAVQLHYSLLSHDILHHC